MIVACIITTDGSKKVLTKLKRAIRSAKKKSSIDINTLIYIVTNNSDLRSQLLDLDIDNFILIDKSPGFGERNNIAIFEIFNFFSPDYFIFLNDDAYLADDFFFEFSKLAKKNGSDLFVPLVSFPNSDIIDSYGAEYFKSGYVKNAQDISYETTMATGACLVVKTSLLKKMKSKYGFYFNPLFHYYLEDTDFSIRAHGVNARFHKSVKLNVFHEGSLTAGMLSEFTIYHTYRNIIWLIILTWPVRYIISYLPYIIFVHMWLMFSSFSFKILFFYGKMIVDTIRKSKELYMYRKKNVSNYYKSFEFESVFSPYFFRTRRINIPY